MFTNEELSSFETSVRNSAYNGAPGKAVGLQVAVSIAKNAKDSLNYYYNENIKAGKAEDQAKADSLAAARVLATKSIDQKKAVLYFTPTTEQLQTSKANAEAQIQSLLANHSGKISVADVSVVNPVAALTFPKPPVLQANNTSTYLMMGAAAVATLIMAKRSENPRMPIVIGAGAIGLIYWLSKSKVETNQTQPIAIQPNILSTTKANSLVNTSISDLSTVIGLTGKFNFVSSVEIPNILKDKLVNAYDAVEGTIQQLTFKIPLSISGSVDYTFVGIPLSKSVTLVDGSQTTINYGLPVEWLEWPSGIALLDPAVSKLAKSLNPSMPYLSPSDIAAYMNGAKTFDTSASDLNMVIGLSGKFVCQTSVAIPDILSIPLATFGNVIEGQIQEYTIQIALSTTGTVDYSFVGIQQSKEVTLVDGSQATLNYALPVEFLTWPSGVPLLDAAGVATAKSINKSVPYQSPSDIATFINTTKTLAI